jgi:hypothetical protein
VDGFTLDHKGFYITRFLEQGSEAIHVDSVPVDPRSGVSINWSPTKFHHGSFSEVDFSNWSFANHSSWVIGSLRGEGAGGDAGIWLIDWTSNKWIRLTPRNAPDQCDNPVVHFTGPVTDPTTAAIPATSVTARRGSRGIASARTFPGGSRRIDLGPGVQAVEVFSARGESLFRYQKQSTGSQSIALPESICQHGVMLIKRY